MPNQTRHEEYAHLKDGLPFVLLLKLKRTPATCSTQQNWHENLEIQLCTNGSGSVLLDGQKFSFQKDDIAVANSNVIHYTNTDDFLEYSCLIVDTAFCRQIGIEPTLLNAAPHFQNDKIKSLFERLEILYPDLSNPCRIAELTDVLLQILIEIRKRHSSPVKSLSTRTRSFENVKSTIAFLRENYAQKLSLDEIAKNVYSDKFVLSREFKKFTGHTIVNYLNNYRCQKAAELIASGVSVAEAAWQCGFESPSFFTKIFQKYMGEPPSKYKKR
jgi:AraC-like DNA-binding protein